MSKTHKQIGRREFVALTAAAAGVMIVPRHVLGRGFQAPSDRLNIALVGCGGQGMSVAQELLTAGDNIVALADVDFAFVDGVLANRVAPRDASPVSPNILKLQEAYTKAARYPDYRRMLEQERGIDAVVVATPDHTHAVIAKAAMELGKHVFVEKPLTWSVQEARVLRDTAARTRVVTQMGNQGHSSNDARLINEWIQAGIIGAVREVHIWTNRPIWPQGVPRPSATYALPAPAPAPAGRGGAPATPPPPAPRPWSQRQLDVELARAVAAKTSPANVNWDLFLGPAPNVPFHPVYHPFNWRGWVDWGTGAIGDMAAHLMDHPYWALGLTYPTSVEATSTPFGLDEAGKPASYPLAMEATYRFAARGNQPPVTLTWRDGGLMPPRPDVLPASVVLQRGGGVIIVGEKGILVHETYGANPKLYPESLMDAARRVPATMERVEGQLHRANWAKAAKGQAKASCPIDYASRLTETMLLGMVAIRTGQGVRIDYDGQAGRITNNPTANDLLQRQFREGWKL